jgi:hypothetical protein
MSRRATLIVTCLGAALALAAVVGSATARRIELSEQRFLLLFREWKVSVPSEPSPVVICEVNAEGSFHSRTISKVSGLLIGYITEARVHSCIVNEGWALNGTEVQGGRTLANTLPWHMLYLDFTGMLPSFTGIKIQLNNGGMLGSVLGLICLYESTAAAGIRGTFEIVPNGTRKQISRFTLAGNEINRKENLFCPATARMTGTATVGTQTEWRLIFVELVT